MKKRIIGIALLILGILIISFGIYNVMSNTTTKQPKKTITKTDALNRTINSSDKVKEEHCLDYLCISNMEMINEDENISIITGNLINKSDKIIPKGWINLVFTVEEEKITEAFYHEELQPNEAVPLELQHKNSKIVNAKDYKIKTPSKEEQEKYEQETPKE